MPPQPPGLSPHYQLRAQVYTGTAWVFLLGFGIAEAFDRVSAWYGWGMIFAAAVALVAWLWKR